jgi:hypothetical protein
MRNGRQKKSEFLAILMQEDILLYAIGQRQILRGFPQYRLNIAGAYLGRT